MTKYKIKLRGARITKNQYMDLTKTARDSQKTYMDVIKDIYRQKQVDGLLNSQHHISCTHSFHQVLPSYFYFASTSNFH